MSKQPEPQAPPLLPCPRCKGEGRIIHSFSLTFRTCPDCNGTGRAPELQAAADFPAPQSRSELWLRGFEAGKAVSAPAPSTTRVLIECERIANIMAWTPIDVGHVYELPMSNGERVNFKVVRIIEQSAPSSDIKERFEQDGLRALTGPSAPSSGGIRDGEAAILGLQGIVDHQGRRIEALEQELAAARQERDEEIAAKVRKIFECADLTVQLKTSRQEHAALVAGLRQIHSRDSKPKGGWCGECDTEYPCRTATLLPPVTNGE